MLGKNTRCICSGWLCCVVALSMMAQLVVGDERSEKERQSAPAIQPLDLSEVTLDADVVLNSGDPGLMYEFMLQRFGTEGIDELVEKFQTTDMVFLFQEVGMAYSATAGDAAAPRGPGAPANDTCAGAEDLVLPALVSVNTKYATTDTLNSSACTGSTSAPRKGVWYRVVGDGTTYTASTCNPGTLVDTIIQVFCGCSDLACVGANDDTTANECFLVEQTANRKSRLSWCTAPGQEYLIHVGAFGSTSAVQGGQIELSVTSNGTACATPAACPVVTRRCCYFEGGTQLCGDFSFGQCVAVAGVWGASGTTCATACPTTTGRCCYVSGGTLTCAVNTNAECNSLGGLWATGLTCATGCPTGRCCYVDSGVSQCATNAQVECDSLNGYWTSGSSCSTACPVGRCCYLNGGVSSCTDAVTENYCETILGGLFTSGSTCATACPSGRCCYLSSGSDACASPVMQGECLLTLNGSYTASSSCSTACPVGRCCYLDEGVGTCAITSSALCTSVLGGTWTTGITSCETSPCPSGRCCYLDGGVVACQTMMVVEQANCTAIGGGFVSGQNCDTPCHTNDFCDTAEPISVGVTPFSTASATTDGPTHSVAECQFLNPIHNNIWYTHTATCNGTLLITTCPTYPGASATYDTRLAVYDGTSPCGSLVLLACNDDTTPCSVSFRSKVEIPVTVGQELLISLGGFGTTSRGTGNLLIECIPSGACCLPSGDCLMVANPAECTTVWGGIFNGADSCDPNPCAIGACCRTDGTCVSSEEPDCAPPHIFHLGEDCNVFECPPAGACCLPGLCLVATQAHCEVDLGGCYSGDGTACAGITEGFDGVIPPTLPSGWVASNAVGGGLLWETSNSGVLSPFFDSAPNSAFIDDPATLSDKRLDSPSFVLPNTPSTLTFRQNRSLESGFDGGVLEISINNGPFDDIITAGGSFVTGGYNGTISASFSSPIAGRQAWTGSTSAAYITSEINLPPAAQGQNVVLRWRMASDTSVSSTGWRIDTIQLQPGGCPVGPCATSNGACCHPDGTCEDDVTQEDCETSGGAFRGEGSSCATSQCAGRCCWNLFGIFDECATTNQETCLNVNFGLWTAGLNCDTDPCPVAKCCSEDGNGPRCDNWTQDHCLDAGGEWFPGLMCQPGDCLPPQNDFCDDRIPLGPLPASVTGTTIGTTNDPLVTCGTTAGTGGAVWYSVIGTGTTITATTCNAFTNFDTKIRVWCGDCELPTCVTGNDDSTCSFSNLRSLVTWCSRPGVEYLILVHGFSTAEGDFQLDVSEDGVSCVSSDACGEICNTCPGDLDDNNNLDGADVQGFTDCQLAGNGPGLPITSGCACADTDLDGDVDLDDVDEFVALLLDPGTCDRGRCCFPNGSCQVLREAACNEAGGIYGGNDTTCTPNPCPQPPPINDDCEDAIEIFDGVTPYSTVNSTTDSPIHTAAECQFERPVNRNIWYTYVATCTGDLTISTCEQLGGSATYDTRMALYSGDCNSLVLVACNDDDPNNACGTSTGGFRSTIVAPVVAGQSYLISVGAFGPDSTGTGNLLIQCASAAICNYPPGNDVWSSTSCAAGGGSQYGFAPTPIPAGFFGPGSDPFTGVVLLGGAAPGDTVVARLAPAVVPNGGSDTIPVEIISLNLVSCQPIIVTYNGGTNPQQWDVQVTLDGPQGAGSMTIHRSNPTGGTFDSIFPVKPRFTFTPTLGGGPIVFNPGVPGNMSATGIPWLDNGPPPCGTGLGGPLFNPGTRLNEGQPCCEESCHEGPSPDHLHCVTPAECQEPCPDGGGNPACPGTGDCFVANGTPGCQDEACCNTVCAVDPFCCDTAWDSICRDEAFELCGHPACGDPGAGDCFSANGTPGCADADCCNTICADDPFCCNVEWDALCADAAVLNCGG